MPSAADQIAARIAAQGPLRFDEYMDLALYGEHGFYLTGGSAGRRGDFITSAEVGPLFGLVLSRLILAEWERLGRPDGFTVVEAGAGPGTLARSIGVGLAASPLRVRYVAVDVSASMRAAHPPGIESMATMPHDAIVGVVLANELLDNMPFRLLVFDGGWREAYVAAEDTRLVEVLLPVEQRPLWLPSTASHGARVPWQQAASAWVDSALGGLVAGRLTVIDYVTPTTAELASLPWRAWLRTYRQHQRGAHYLVAPGGQDITAQVALDQLRMPDVVETQAELLGRWGIDELVEEGRREWAAHASAPTVAAMAMRSRVREADALTATVGLGAFTALSWTVGASTRD